MRSAKTQPVREPDKPPDNETLRKVLGILFYVLVAAGAVYHFIIAR